MCTALRVIVACVWAHVAHCESHSPCIPPKKNAIALLMFVLPDRDPKPVNVSALARQLAQVSIRWIAVI